MTYLRFGIRDLLWAMVLVAVAMAWWLDRSHLAGEIAKAEREQESVFSFYLGLSR